MDDMLSGPFNQIVIFDNEYHVSEYVWKKCDRGTLQCFCCNRLIRNWKLSDAHNELLHDIGFGLFANTNIVIQNDCALITTLVER